MAVEENEKSSWQQALFPVMLTRPHMKAKAKAKA